MGEHKFDRARNRKLGVGKWGMGVGNREVSGGHSKKSS